MTEEVKPDPVISEIAPAELRLGSLSITDPVQMVAKATVLANALAEIIHAQRDADNKPTLYVIIQGRKYVRAEGWTTLGAMLGVVPIEVYCNPLPDGAGYRAKVKLVRISDGMQVGGASAICKNNEKGWNKADADDYATHSKAITRATGKAFRLSFAWIMKLAGFQATPAEELYEVDGSEEQAQEVVNEKKAEAASKGEEKKTAKASVFMSWPAEHNGHNFFITNRLVIMENGLLPELESRKARWNQREMGWYLDAQHAEDIRFIFIEKLGKDRFIEQKFGK